MPDATVSPSELPESEGQPLQLPGSTDADRDALDDSPADRGAQKRGRHMWNVWVTSISSEE